MEDHQKEIIKEIIKKYEKLKAQDRSDEAIHKILGQKASGERNHPLYNISPFTFKKLIADPEGLPRNLVSYIKGFSPKAAEIFEKFDFEKERYLP